MLFLSCFVVLSCVSVCWCFVVAFWGGWSLGYRLWCLIVTLSLSGWCPVVRLVSRVGCGALLYQFLILALFLTFISIEIVSLSDHVMVPERFYTGFTVVVSF